MPGGSKNFRRASRADVKLEPPVKLPKSVPEILCSASGAVYISRPVHPSSIRSSLYQLSFPPFLYPEQFISVVQFTLPIPGAV